MYRRLYVNAAADKKAARPALGFRNDVQVTAKRSGQLRHNHLLS